MSASRDQSPSDDVALEVGAYFVAWGFYSYDVLGPITAVTPKQVRTKRHTHERRTDRSGVLFSGTEKACQDLYSVLKSSEARKGDDERAARESHLLRVSRAVEAAIAKAEGQ